ncbi:MAG: FecR domain-containing protein [Deltaproteobacteria bacterium]|nr:FecR domain-containing protein [Deltaproteobacteria bacterium]
MSTFRHAPLLAAPALALFVVVIAVVWAPRTAPPNIHYFASGHRIVAGPSSRLDWEDTGDHLEIRLHAGEVMFDIDPDAAQVVRVRSGAVSVRVLGTVFTVDRRATVTRVAVFEGSVAVAGGGPLSLLGAGDHWEGGPGRGLPVEGISFEPRFFEEATWAADRRRENSPPVDDFVPTLPPVPDLAADGRLGPGGPEEEDVAPPSVEDARSALTGRRHEEAQALADRALADGVTADWLLIRGDALRGQGQLAEAAADYTRAAVVGDGRDRAVAGLSAARVLGRELGRGRAARELLVSSGALAASSPVRAEAEALVQELGAARLDFGGFEEGLREH